MSLSLSCSGLKFIPDIEILILRPIILVKSCVGLFVARRAQARNYGITANLVGLKLNNPVGQEGITSQRRFKTTFTEQFVNKQVGNDTETGQEETQVMERMHGVSCREEKMYRRASTLCAL